MLMLTAIKQSLYDTFNVIAQFYIRGVSRQYPLIFPQLHEIICCGYSLEAPQRGASNECPQHVFVEKYEKNVCFFAVKYVLSRAMG